MTTSNKRGNGHRNAVMNNTRVQRAVSKVITDQTRAEELLEQLNATSTTAAAAAAPADVVDTTAAETPEVPEDKQPENAPEDLPQPDAPVSDEQIFLAAFAAEKTFFKMLINTLSIDEGELYTWLTGLWCKRSSLIKEYRNGNFKAMREILRADEPSFDHALAVKHVAWLLPLVQVKAEEKLAAYGEFAVLLGSELLKDFLAGFKSNLEARLEARREESGKSATSSTPSVEAKRPSPRLASETIIVNGTRHTLVANGAEILERNGCDCTDAPLCIDEYGLYMIINQRPMRCNWMA